MILFRLTILICGDSWGCIHVSGRILLFHSTGKPWNWPAYQKHLVGLRLLVILLMKEILHQLTGSFWSHYLQALVQQCRIWEPSTVCIKCYLGDSGVATSFTWLHMVHFLDDLISFSDYKKMMVTITIIYLQLDILAETSSWFLLVKIHKKKHFEDFSEFWWSLQHIICVPWPDIHQAEEKLSDA